MSAPEAEWKFPYQPQPVDPKLFTAILGCVNDSLDLTMDQELEAAWKTACVVTGLYNAVEAGFISGIEAELCVNGYRTLMSIPDGVVMNPRNN